MMSATSDYAFRAILVLARTPGDGPVSTDEIARATCAPARHLVETMNVLVQAGIVTASGQAREGFRLAIPADRLSLARIADCFEEGLPAPCPSGTVLCDPLRPCAAHEGWPKLVTARRAMLSTTTVADLLAGGRSADLAPGESAPAAPPTTTIAWRSAGRAVPRQRSSLHTSSTVETQIMSLRLHHPSSHAVPRFVTTLVVALTALLVILSLTA